jgi:hypothetical protein
MREHKINKTKITATKTYIKQINHQFIWIWWECAVDVYKLKNKEETESITIPEAHLFLITLLNWREINIKDKLPRSPCEFADAKSQSL